MAKKATSYLNRLSSLSLLQDSSTRTSLAISAIALLSFLALAIVLPSKDSLLNQLFPKPKTHAAGVPATVTDWPQLQYNAQHIGRTSVQVNPNYSAKWVWMDKTHIVKNFVSGVNKSITDGFAPGFTSTVIFANQMQPIMADGKTFFGAMNGTIYAVNAATGDNLWDFTTGGAIVATSAYDSGIVVVPSMDGKIYGLDETNGSVVWTYATGAGISVAPTIMNGVAYIGSRDGTMYALDTQTGALKWKYAVRDPNGTYNNAPIMAPASVSEDGTVVLFGAENMDFYALNTSNGTEKWAPTHVVGQSFQFSWPVVIGSNVVVTTMSSIGGTERTASDVTAYENALAALSANPNWTTEEKPAILNWLAQNPERKLTRVFNVNTGAEPFTVPTGIVGAGDGMPPIPPVVDNSGRLLTYFHTKVATFLGTSPTYGCFGTNYCPDISAMDMTTGDRVTLPNSNPSKFNPEIDNMFYLDVGGSNLYLQNAFRGTDSINLSTGTMTRITHSLAYQDGGNFRGWGYNVIYYGNDSQQTTDTRPPQSYQSTQGWVGMGIATAGTTNMLFINEPDINAVVGVAGQ